MLSDRPFKFSSCWVLKQPFRAKLSGPGQKWALFPHFPRQRGKSARNVPIVGIVGQRVFAFLPNSITRQLIAHTVQAKGTT